MSWPASFCTPPNIRSRGFLPRGRRELKGAGAILSWLHGDEVGQPSPEGFSAGLFSSVAGSTTFSRSSNFSIRSLASAQREQKQGVLAGFDALARQEALAADGGITKHRL